MDNKPEKKYSAKYHATYWCNEFRSFKALCYVPDNDLEDGVLNFGFTAPYLIVFAPFDPDIDSAHEFAVSHGFRSLAEKYATSVLFIYPLGEKSWKDAPSDMLDVIFEESRIHQYYDKGIVEAHNRFTGKLDGYFIRGAKYRMCLYGYGESADHIGRNCIKHFEGEGMWGRADCSPTVCILSGLSELPSIEADDIPIVSVGNSKEIDEYIKKSARYTYFVDKEDVPGTHDAFIKHFRRMITRLEKDPDTEKEGLITEFGTINVRTSPDNERFKDKSEHPMGYFAFYRKGAFDNGPVPLLMCFHGGGDSALYIANMAGWTSVCLRHGFLLICVEDHVDSTATEAIELVEFIKSKYPVDSSRIYSTGFSMGGCKTWDMVQEYPEVFAAVAPMDATFELGLNMFGKETLKPMNTSVAVPVFYSGGEKTPLPELPFQAQKCIDRMGYVLKLNDVPVKYDVKLDDVGKWENPIWGISGDKRIVTHDPYWDGNLTIELFESSNGNCYCAFSSIDNQGHECSEHTCENAWRFLESFSRDKDGKLIGGDINDIYNCFTF